MYFAYVVKSIKNGRLYYGSTNNLERRLYEHNLGRTFSLKNVLPVRLVYFEEFESLKEARQRELFFKSGQGRQFVKLQLAERSPEATGRLISPRKI